MGQTYDALLADRTALLLQLQGFAAASDPVKYKPGTDDSKLAVR